MLCFLAVQGTYRDIEETRSRFLYVAKFSKLCHLQSSCVIYNQVVSFTIHSDFSSLLFLFFVFDSTSLPSLSMEAVFQFKFYILRLIT